MQSPYFAKMADVLVNYSTAVQKGDIVRINGDAVAEPLLVELYLRVLEAGGHPLLEMRPSDCKWLKLTQGSEEQIGWESITDLFEVENIDVYIGVGGSANTRALSNIAPERLALAEQARKKFIHRMVERAAEGELRWCATQAPCQASAQDAERSLHEYAEFVFKAGLLHLDDPVAAWQQISERQQRLVDYLQDKSEVRFTSPNGTDLTVAVADRIWVNCDGKENFPDGEVFTGPIEDATEGTVCFSFPAVYGGREANGVRLEFKNGRVVAASAEKGEDYLLALLEQDSGARVLGEIAIGTNYSIQEYTKNTLFDEKIGGTFHAAVGMSYPETGGKNESGLHWDMVCDLREGGKIFVDGELISENGRFLRDDWPR